jgi:hypothetical protein
MNSIKIKIYWTKVFEIDDDIISNSDDLNFSEDINSWQSWFDIDLLVDFTTTEYKVWDMLEYSIYNDEHKNGLLKYTGVITKIKRTYSSEQQWITLECESLTYILVQKNVNKTYNWTYQSIVDDMITDLWSNSCNMNFLWTEIFKNKVQNTATTSLTLDWNLLQGLQKLFENKVFFINQFGEITDTFPRKHLLKFWRDIFSNVTQEDSSWIINAELEIQSIQDINVGDMIKIVNTDSFLNLDNQQITKLDFTLENKTVIIWEINQIKVT